VSASEQAARAVDAMIAEAIAHAERVVRFAMFDNSEFRLAKALLMLHDPQLRGPVEAKERERIETERVALPAPAMTAEPNIATTPCDVCAELHTVGAFHGHPLPMVVVTVSDHREASLGQRGTVVDWKYWVGSTEWIRVEFTDGHRANFAPCQLRRIA
jgi:hypothetical protein